MGSRTAPVFVRRELASASKRALARRLPWPYNGMVSDLTSAIQTSSIYLAAAGLMYYTEACGRQMFFRGSSQAGNYHCFARFLAYMGADAILARPVYYAGRELKFRDAVRNGLLHEYFMKGNGGGVAMTSSDPMARQSGFIVNPDGTVWFAVTPYFNLFAAALDRAHKSGELPAWNPWPPCA